MILSLLLTSTFVLGVGGAPPLKVTADCEKNPTTGLEAALKTVRTTRSKGTAAVISVQGTCHVSEPVALGPADSNLEIVGVGTVATPSPGISGGVAIAGWTIAEAAACKGCHIYVAALPKDATNARQFYVDGVRANKTIMLFPQATATRTAVGFKTPLASTWTHNDGIGIEMLHRGTSSCNYSSRIQWAEHKLPVASITGGEFVMVQPAWNHSNGTTLLPCYVENVFELLGDAKLGKVGDYYLDHKAGKVYYVSPTPPTNAVLPQSVGLMRMTNVSDVTVSSLELKEATWLLDNNGFVHWQAGCYVKGPAGFEPGFDGVTCMPGSIDVQRGRKIAFTNCSFTKLGAAGVSFTKGSQNNSVTASLFEDISGTAVSVGAVDTYNETDLNDHDADHTIADCVIRYVATEYLGACGITTFYSRGTLITHNEVYHVPYSGVSVGWGWTSTQEVTWPKMPWDHGNVISNNYIHEVDGIMGDGGSLYTLGVQGNRPFREGSIRKSYPAVPLPPLKILPMSQMTENFVEHNGWPDRPRNSQPGDGTHGPGGVYTDNGSTGWNVSSNVFNEVTVWAIACYTSGIDNNSYINNTAVCTGWCGPIQKQYDCPMANNAVKKSMQDLSNADLAVIAKAGPRKPASRWAM
eukprot:gene6901-7060_t